MKKYLNALVISTFMVLAAGPAILAQGNRPDVSTQRAQAQENSQTARQQSQERVEAIKQEVAERRAEIEQEVCERRQDRLNTVMPRLATSSNTLKSTFDTIYERVQGFYDSGQLTVENYDELKEAVDAAQANAEAAVEAINNYEFELDCENSNVGQQLDGFRQAVSEARTELKSYQEALVNLISALRAEAAEQQETENGTEESNNAQEGNVNSQGVRNEE